MKGGWAVPILIRRSLRQHALSTTVTAGAAAIACGLTMSVFAMSAQSRRAFAGDTCGFDGVLGARGSPLQLVLNSVFHLDTSPGNIPWSLYEQIAADPRVALAIPYAVGDSYRGFRIVGTTPELFERVRTGDGRTFRVRGPGILFDPSRREAVVGSFAAERTGMRVGSKFNPSHGIGADEEEDHEHSHDEEYVVVGVLEATNTPMDRVIWIPIDGMLRMGGHVLRGTGEEYRARPGEAIPDEHKEVSAVMVRFRDPLAGHAMMQQFSRDGRATLAWPIGAVMTALFNKIGWIAEVLTLVAYLILVVAAGSILAAIHNTMNERRRDFAILRALGARRRTLFAAVVGEAVAISAIGAAAGFLVYSGLMAVVAAVVRAESGVVLEPFAWHPAMVLTPAAMIGMGVMAGMIPACKAYATDVATNLAPGT